MKRQQIKVGQEYAITDWGAANHWKRSCGMNQLRVKVMANDAKVLIGGTYKNIGFRAELLDSLDGTSQGNIFDAVKANRFLWTWDEELKHNGNRYENIRKNRESARQDEIRKDDLTTKMTEIFMLDDEEFNIYNGGVSIDADAIERLAREWEGREQMLDSLIKNTVKTPPTFG